MPRCWKHRKRTLTPSSDETKATQRVGACRLAGASRSLADARHRPAGPLLPSDSTIANESSNILRARLLALPGKMYGSTLLSIANRSVRSRALKVSVLVLGLLLITGGESLIGMNGAAAQSGNRGSFTCFYEKSDLDTVSSLINVISEGGRLSKRDALPPVIGSLAALYERYPYRVDDWVAGEFSR